jgi:hypothetical protein
MADATTNIQADIDELKQRIASTADELDSRLARLPRLAAWTWRHKRALALAGVVTTGALAVVGAGRRRAATDDIEGRYEITLSRR